MSISPNQESGSGSGFSDPTWRPDHSGGARPRILTIVVLVGLVAVFGATIYLVTQVRATRADLAAANKKIQTHEEQLAKLEGSVVRTSQQADQNISALRGEVTSTRGQIQQAASRAQSEAIAKSEKLAAQLAAEQAAQKEAAARLGGEVEQLRTVTGATENKLGSLTGDVSGVKTELSSTKDELKKTIADLKSVRGDLGVQSGLIATNGSELAALKRLGERNYFEFDLKKTKAPQRVGAVSLRLKTTDLKRNRYTVEVIADDKLTEKKDRTINEPVQFYVAKVRIPYEIVVNQVQKDRIVGYMATPKDGPR